MSKVNYYFKCIGLLNIISVISTLNKYVEVYFFFHEGNNPKQ